MDPRLRAADLATGDRAVAAQDWSDLRVRRVEDVTDPDFEAAFGRLWAEFGARGEMEHRAVIAARLTWDPRRRVGGAALLYELLVLRRGGTVVAIRDHTAVTLLDAAGWPRPTIVHLSHAFVDPVHRGTGLAAWLRALPVSAAERCAAAAGSAPGAPIVLAAEMEHRNPEDPACMARLRSYERAGFHKLDPACAPYRQPDLRAPEAYVGGRPVSLPLALVLRRVGAEQEETMPAAEVAAVVQSIYAVYGVHVAAAALEPLRAAAVAWTARESVFPLLPPTA